MNSEKLYMKKLIRYAKVARLEQDLRVIDGNDNSLYTLINFLDSIEWIVYYEMLEDWLNGTLNITSNITSLGSNTHGVHEHESDPNKVYIYHGYDMHNLPDDIPLFNDDKKFLFIATKKSLWAIVETWLEAKFNKEVQEIWFFRENDEVLIETIKSAQSNEIE